MNLHDKKILVTGAEGFIGSHLVERLLELGANVRAFVLYNSFNSWGWLDTLPNAIKNELDVVTGDIRDPHSVRQAMQDCDTVLNLAALIGIPYSYQAPDSYIETNVKGTLNILQAARHADVTQVIHTSTSEVYGSAQYVPICEKHPLCGQSPYSASKIAADQLALSFYHTFDLPVSIIRPFNTYGPRQSARAVIPATIIQIMEKPDDIKLGNLYPTRDFNYVEDTVNGFVAALASDRGIGEVINIGSNFEISIGDTVELIAELMGRSINVNADQQRVRAKKSEVDRLYASNAKAKEILNWSPHYAGLDGFKKGLQKTIEWFTNPDNLKRYKASCYNL